MSVLLLPAASRTVSVGVAQDPYKKYWWVVLALCGATGGWLCMPLMETPVGSGHYEAAKPGDEPSGEQALAAASAGAGHAYDLAMGPSGAKGEKAAFDAPDSMLFQAPGDGAPASGASAAAGAASPSLAGDLKKIGQSRDASGWGGEKARRGFDAPRMAGGALSGLGGVSGGRGGSAGGIGMFGERTPQVQFSPGREGPPGGGANAADGARRSALGSLGQMAAQAGQAALNHSGDASAGGMSRLFDGAKGANQVGGSGPASPAGGAKSAAYAALDEAPVNLKNLPTTPDAKKIAEPPATPEPSATAASGNSGQQMLMMLAGVAVSALVGGMVPGLGGQMLSMVTMTAIQQMEAQQQAQMQAKNQTLNGGTH